MNLLGWYWLIKLYRFQVYNSVVHHLCIVLCVPHSKSSLLPAWFIPLYPLLPAPTHLSLWQSPYCCLCLSFCSLVCFFPLLLPPLSPSLCPHSFWPLSVCSLYLSLYYFVCLLICSLKFHIQVKSFLWLAYFTWHNTL